MERSIHLDRRTWGGCVLGGLVAQVCSAQGTGTTPPRVPRAQDDDFELRGSVVTAGEGRTVQVRDHGETVVARVHVQVDQTYALFLPDGRLISVPADSVEPTDRPFQPLSIKELADRLAREFEGFKVKQTRRFIYVYDTSELFYTGTSRILETMYPPLFDYYLKRLKLPVHNPATPLVVVMFRTDGEFQAYRRMPSGVVAYYNGLDNRVAMYELSALSRIDPQIAMQQAISTVAHEGVHQILANIGAQQRLSSWPIWISEGLAEYFAPTEITRDVRWKGVGRINDLRLPELNRLLLSAAIDPGPSGVSANRASSQRLDFAQIDMLIETLVRAEGLSSAGYAAAWGLTHFLADRREKEFPAYLASISKLRPLEALTPDEKLATFKEHFGSDLSLMAKQFVAHIGGLVRMKN